MNCLLKDGCPCTNKTCANWGNCAQCIKQHVEKVSYAVACQRDKSPKK